jgi:hypothetical protein
VSHYREVLHHTTERWSSALAETVQRQGTALLIICLAAGVAAQSLLDKGERLTLAGLLYAGAALLFVVIFRKKREPQAALSHNTEPGVDWRLVGLACVLGVLAFPRFSGNLFTPSGVALWVGGLALMGLAAWRRPKGAAEISDKPPARSSFGDGLTVRWNQLLVIGIMALGAFYRLNQIDRIPAEMGCDLPHIYNNIRLLLRGELLIFFPSHPGREGLFFYLAAPFCSLFGLSHTTIKMSSALIGVATIPAIYLLGKELFDTETGLFAAFFLSISHWHIIITRTGFRSCTMPLVLVLMWYFFVRALRSGRAWFYALAGFFWGLGFYTYNAFMISFATVAGMVVAMALAGQGGAVRRDLGKLLMMVLVAAVVLIPLGRYALESPESYFYRVGTRITGMEAPISGSIPQILLTTMSKALLMFNYRGDGVAVNNVPFYREFGFISGVMLVLGLGYVLWHWRHRYNATIPVVLVTMLLPSALSLAFPQEVPNAGRAFGALAPAIILAAVAAALVRRRFEGALASYDARRLHFAITLDESHTFAWHISSQAVLRTLGTLALVVTLALEARAVYPLYFREYVAHLPDHNYSISLEMARIIDAFADDGESYIKIQPYWYDGNAVRAQLRLEDQSWHNEIDRLDRGQLPLAGPPGKFAVLIHPDDQAAIQTLQEAFPGGIALTRRNYEGKVSLVIFYGER